MNGKHRKTFVGILFPLGFTEEAFSLSTLGFAEDVLSLSTFQRELLHTSHTSFFACILPQNSMQSFGQACIFT
jgi:hypothetical protein